MATVSEHYENLLADYYSWMFGDFDERVEANHAFFELNGIAPRGPGIAVDLGAGPGFQSIALAQLGFKVLAMDLSGKLLDELKSRRGDLPITAVKEDLLDFARHCPGPIEVCVCMGDTLPHLASREAIATLFGRIRGKLSPGGKLVLTFRDLTHELKELDRFIPVRSDGNALFTCFLEYGQDHVQVHDLVYERKGGAWHLRKSSYTKLRISRAWTLELLQDAGFTVLSDSSEKGMITIIAGRKG